MAEHNLSWNQVVQMCHHAHPKEDEQLVADAFQVEQLDLEAAEAEVAEAEVAERLATARAEIVDARAELAEARAAMAAPPTDVVIHDIAADDDDVPAASSAPATRSFCLRRSRP
jgi:FAD/FMN-containing dehydrogenase